MIFSCLQLGPILRGVADRRVGGSLRRKRTRGWESAGSNLRDRRE